MPLIRTRRPQRRSHSSRGRLGFWGPLPSYSRRTRSGRQVRVTGCCLPLALGMLSAPVLGAHAAWQIRSRRELGRTSRGGS